MSLPEWAEPRARLVGGYILPEVEWPDPPDLDAQAIERAVVSHEPIVSDGGVALPRWGPPKRNYRKLVMDELDENGMPDPFADPKYREDEFRKYLLGAADVARAQKDYLQAKRLDNFRTIGRANKLEPKAHFDPRRFAASMGKLQGSSFATQSVVVPGRFGGSGGGRGHRRRQGSGQHAGAVGPLSNRARMHPLGPVSASVQLPARRGSLRDAVASPTTDYHGVVDGVDEHESFQLARGSSLLSDGDDAGAHGTHGDAMGAVPPRRSGFSVAEGRPKRFKWHRRRNRRARGSQATAKLGKRGGGHDIHSPLPAERLKASYPGDDTVRRASAASSASSNSSGSMLHASGQLSARTSTSGSSSAGRARRARKPRSRARQRAAKERALRDAKQHELAKLVAMAEAIGEFSEAQRSAVRHRLRPRPVPKPPVLQVDDVADLMVKTKKARRRLVIDDVTGEVEEVDEAELYSSGESSGSERDTSRDAAQTFNFDKHGIDPTLHSGMAMLHFKFIKRRQTQRTLREDYVVRRAKFFEEVATTHKETVDARPSSAKRYLHYLRQCRALGIQPRPVGRSGNSGYIEACEEMDIVPEPVGIVRRNPDVLRLANYRIGDRFATAVSKSLEHDSYGSKPAERVDLRSNRLTHVGAKHIFAHLKTQELLELNIGDNRIGYEACEALSDVLETSFQLVALNLEGNQIGDAGVFLLARGLRECVTLTKLVLRENNIGEAGADCIGKLLQWQGGGAPTVPPPQKKIAQLWVASDTGGKKKQATKAKAGTTTLRGQATQGQGLTSKGKNFQRMRPTVIPSRGSFNDLPSLGSRKNILDRGKIDFEDAATMTSSMKRASKRGHAARRGETASASSRRRATVDDEFATSGDILSPGAASARKGRAGSPTRSLTGSPTTRAQRGSRRRPTAVEDASLQAAGAMPPGQPAGDVEINDPADTTESIESLNAVQRAALAGPPSVAFAGNGIQHLDLAWNNIRGDGAVALFSGISANNKLKELDLSFNALGSWRPGEEYDVAVSALSTMLSHNTSLQHLDISHTNINSHQVELLEEGLETNHSLRGLHCSGNHCFVDARGFVHMWREKVGAAGAHTADPRPPTTAASKSRGKKPPSDLQARKTPARNPTWTAPTTTGDSAVSWLGSPERAEKLEAMLEEEATDLEGAFLRRNDLGDYIQEMGSANGHVQHRVVTMSTHQSDSIGARAFLRAAQSAVPEPRHFPGETCWVCGKWRPFRFAWRAPVSGPLARTSVKLLTSFDNWRPDPMELQDDGSWAVERMVPNVSFRFMFEVDGVKRAALDELYTWRVAPNLEVDGDGHADVPRIIGEDGYLVPGGMVINFIGSEEEERKRVQHASRVSRAVGKIRSVSAFVRGQMLATAKRESEEKRKALEQARLDAFERRVARAEEKRRKQEEEEDKDTGAAEAALRGLRGQRARRGDDTWDVVDDLEESDEESSADAAAVETTPPDDSRVGDAKKTATGAESTSSKDERGSAEDSSDDGSVDDLAADKETTSPARARGWKVIQSRLSDIRLQARSDYEDRTVATIRRMDSSTSRRNALALAALHGRTSMRRLQTAAAVADHVDLDDAIMESNTVPKQLPALLSVVKHVVTHNKTFEPLLEEASKPRLVGLAERVKVKTMLLPRTRPPGVVVTGRKPWAFADSVFASYVLDTDKILDTCFTRDMEHNKCHRVVKDAEQFARVKTLMREHFGELKAIFKHCAAASGADPFSIQWNGFTELMQQCKVPDTKYCKLKDLDTIFIATNVEIGPRKTVKAGVAKNTSNSLMRHEFLEAIVRVAQAKYVKTRQTDDMASAVKMLLVSHILPFANYDDGNDFRRKHLYCEEVDMVFKRYMGRLNQVFQRHSGREKLPGEKQWMSVQEFYELVDKAGLIDDTMTERDVRFQYCYSMMSVADETRTAKHSHMTPIEFLEACARIASVRDKTDLPLYQKLPPTLDAFVQTVDFLGLTT